MEDAEIERILKSADAVEIIGRQVDLKPTGKGHVGLCPFHEENTPSFYVYPDSRYHCYGCPAKGDIFQYFMEMDRLSFPEAVAKVAEEAGVPPPAKNRLDAGPSRRFRCLQEVAEFYVRGPSYFDEPRKFFAERVISADMVKKHRIGYAARKSSHLDSIIRKFSAADVTKIGLLCEDNGRTFAFLRHRCIFPIMNRAGAVVSLVGRTIDSDGKPKYLVRNNEFFQRSTGFYGLHTVGSNREVAVVEGPMDVIRTHSVLGMASLCGLGTALTDTQLSALVGMADSILFIFDGDSAGKKAASTVAHTMLGHLQSAKRIRFAFLPAGEDPDTYFQHHSDLSGLKVLSQLEVLDCSLRHFYNLDEIYGQARATEWILKALPGSKGSPMTEIMRAALARIIQAPLSALYQSTPG